MYVCVYVYWTLAYPDTLGPGLVRIGEKSGYIYVKVKVHDNASRQDPVKLSQYTRIPDNPNQACCMNMFTCIYIVCKYMSSHTIDDTVHKHTHTLHTHTHTLTHSSEGQLN